MSIPANASLADIGEFGLVEALAERFPQGDNVLVGPGDDAALVSVPDGRVVVSTDLHVETRHFRRVWASANDIGHRVAAAALLASPIFQRLRDAGASARRDTGLAGGHR